jgi:hypothetical protein
VRLPWPHTDAAATPAKLFYDRAFVNRTKIKRDSRLQFDFRQGTSFVADAFSLF